LSPAENEKFAAFGVAGCLGQCSRLNNANLQSRSFYRLLFSSRPAKAVEYVIVYCNPQPSSGERDKVSQ
jgi:hypothetical protein